METIDLVKNFENVGFTRGQAEMQVRTIADIKQGLMTQKDGEQLASTLRAEVASIKSELKGDMARIESGMAGLKGDVTRIESSMAGLKGDLVKLESELKAEIKVIKNDIRWVPIQSTFYTITTAVAILTLLSHWPKIQGLFYTLFSK